MKLKTSRSITLSLLLKFLVLGLWFPGKGHARPSLLRDLGLFQNRITRAMKINVTAIVAASIRSNPVLVNTPELLVLLLVVPVS